MFPENSQVVNIETRQNHWVPSTTSDLLYKTAVAQDGRSIWHGMIYVDPQAQQTDAYQSNRNLVLDDSADVKSIPGLEIHADDVKCSHGATVGRIDSEELFYLKARGIPEKEAEKLIIEGFFNQILNNFSLEKTRVEMRERLIERISM
jgi:Fe-S cluster assembly protein SufD